MTMWTWPSRFRGRSSKLQYPVHYPPDHDKRAEIAEREALLSHREPAARQIRPNEGKLQKPAVKEKPLTKKQCGNSRSPHRLQNQKPNQCLKVIAKTVLPYWRISGNLDGIYQRRGGVKTRRGGVRSGRGGVIIVRRGGELGIIRGRRGRRRTGEEGTEEEKPKRKERKKKEPESIEPKSRREAAGWDDVTEEIKVHRKSVAAASDEKVPETKTIQQVKQAWNYTTLDTRIAATEEGMMRLTDIIDMIADKIRKAEARRKPGEFSVADMELLEERVEELEEARAVFDQDHLILKDTFEKQKEMETEFVEIKQLGGQIEEMKTEISTKADAEEMEEQLALKGDLSLLMTKVDYLEFETAIDELGEAIGLLGIKFMRKYISLNYLLQTIQITLAFELREFSLKSNNRTGQFLSLRRVQAQ
ncbi:hypothetical protein CEXT_803231 [Caerostris extrusa]|uniref:Uncharacterized protein n=1 Tax=Caerostris extrusa TaxID=172846 RepID=A0AAV4V7B1_CAEEX|nr:hypothetical protein CEXT_803231 [Caerostris extrusa]